MKIAVDARQLYRQNRRGIGKSLRLLLMHLSQQNPSWHFNLYHRYSDNDTIDVDIGLNTKAHYLRMIGDKFECWERFRLPLAASLSRDNLLYCPANMAPRFGIVPSVVSIHDLIPLELAPNDPNSISWARSVRLGANQAKKVHTDSVYTANQLLKLLDIPASKIEVIPLAADPSFKEVTDAGLLGSLRKKYSIPIDKPYVLVFGAEDPRKNTLRIIDAWGSMAYENRSQYHLVIVGIQPNYIDSVRSYGRKILADCTATITGFADELDLPGLVSGSELLCYPSTCEGFGLPVLEAFGCKTAVITSKSTSLVEVAGDSALLVDPLSTDSIRNALDLILGNDDLRNEYRMKGYIRSKQYSWSKISQDFSLLFRSVI